MAKNLIFCFDGSQCHPNDAKPEKAWFGLGKVKDHSISNIFKLHLLFGGDLYNNPTSDSQHSFYYSGVGTHGSWLYRKLNVLFAPPLMDVRHILNRAGADLISHYQPGDQVFIFGFSRGAALARRFAAVIQKRYLTSVSADEKLVRFLGVFDTVAAIRRSGLTKMPRTRVVFEDFTISPQVQEALHLVSIDENRKAFRPTLMNKDPRVEEVWFPGAHSDVGGGFAKHGLSDVALEFMVHELQRRNTGLTILQPEQVDLSKLRVDKNRYQITREDIAIQPNPNGVEHTKKRKWPISAITLGDRLLRVNINDKPSTRDRTTIFESMAARMKQNMKYKPKPVAGKEYYLLAEDGVKKECKGYQI